MQKSEILSEINSYQWWHTIDLGDGILTPGAKSLAYMDQDFAKVFEGIDLRGQSVLDVGAWNGGYSVEAARRGAARVVGLDNPNGTGQAFKARQTFELVSRITGLGLEFAAVDLDEPRVSLSHLGQFDYVLLLGVFYHLIDPIAALRDLAPIAAKGIVIESYVDNNLDSRPAMVFFPGNELNNDGSNWWGPNKACIVELLRTFGFGNVKAQTGSYPDRAIVHGFK